MKNLVIIALFGLMYTNMSFAATVMATDVIECNDCDKCKNGEKCDKCKAEGAETKCTKDENGKCTKEGGKCCKDKAAADNTGAKAINTENPATLQKASCAKTAKKCEGGEAKSCCKKKETEK